MKLLEVGKSKLSGEGKGVGPSEKHREKRRIGIGRRAPKRGGRQREGVREGD